MKNLRTFYVDNAKNEWFVGKQFYVSDVLLTVTKVGLHQFKAKPIL